MSSNTFYPVYINLPKDQTRESESYSFELWNYRYRMEVAPVTYTSDQLLEFYKLFPKFSRYKLKKMKRYRKHMYLSFLLYLRNKYNEDYKLKRIIGGYHGNGYSLYTLNYIDDSCSSCICW